MDEKTKIKRDLSAKQRLEEVARLQKKVSADIDAGAWPFSEAFSERGASAHLCRLHELTCLTCRSREQLSSEAAQDVSSWATAIESLAKQIPDSEDNCDTLLAAIGGLARVIRMTVENDIVPEVLEPERCEESMKEMRSLLQPPPPAQSVGPGLVKVAPPADGSAS